MSGRLSSQNNTSVPTDLDNLSFAHLSVANRERCTYFGHSVQDWSPTDWACAMAGECGEACNLIKKQRRGDAVDVDDIADELADLVIYTDLLAARLGIDLGAAVRRKFNAVSERLKLPVVLLRLP